MVSATPATAPAFIAVHDHLHVEGVLRGDLLAPLKTHEPEVAQKRQTDRQKGIGHVPEGRCDPLPHQKPGHLLEGLGRAGEIVPLGSVGVDVVGDLVAAGPVDGLIDRPVRDELDVAVVHVDEQQRPGGIAKELQKLLLGIPLRRGGVVQRGHQRRVPVGQHLLHDLPQGSFLRLGKQLRPVLDDDPIDALPRLLRRQGRKGQRHHQRRQHQQRREKPFTTLHCWRPPS